MNNNSNLNKKLLQLQKTVRALSKNSEGFGYSYVSGSKLLYFIRPKMDELGLRLVPNTISVEQKVVETSPETDKKPAKYEVLVLLHKTFTWVDVESGETETTDFYSQGCNGWDKAVGSAETYAERYFLLKYFHIATDEDDVDAIHAEEEPQEEVKENAPKKARKSTKKVADDTEVGRGVESAVEAAKSAKNAEELTAVWNKFKGEYGQNPEFIMAISKNPVNPKKRG